MLRRAQNRIRHISASNPVPPGVLRNTGRIWPARTVFGSVEIGCCVQVLSHTTVHGAHIKARSVKHLRLGLRRKNASHSRTM